MKTTTTRNGAGKKEHRRTNSRTLRPAPLSGAADEIATRLMGDRVVFLLARSLGSEAIVTVTSGARYRGVLTSATLEENLHVVLSYPELYATAPGEEALDADLPKTLIIPNSELLDVELLDVDLAPKPEAASVPEAVPAPETAPETRGFRTDTDISGKQTFKERDLQRWIPDEGTLDWALEDDSTGTWDQFAVNEKKFGVESTYDEHLYTTRIKTDAPDYHQRLRKAEQMAREIEGQGYNGNIHLAEERGLIVDDSGVDEEDKYSGVDRRGDELMAALKFSKSTSPAERAPGKYVPPRQRAAEIHNDPAIILSSGKPASGNSGKSLSEFKAAGTPSALPGFKIAGNRPSSVPQKPMETETKPVAGPAKENIKPVADPAKITKPVADPAKIAKPVADPARVAKPVADIPAKPAAKEISKPLDIPAKPVDIPVKPVDIPVKPVDIPAKPAKETPKPVDIPAKPVTRSVKHFQSESTRLNVQSEINSLKEFSATFKVPQKFPEDLLPILAKDKAKQDEIIRKQTDKPAASTASEDSVPVTSAPITSAATSAISSKSSAKTKTKMDPKAPAFKLNPASVSFTPSQPAVFKSPVSMGTRYKRYGNVTPASFFGKRVPTEHPGKNIAEDFNLFEVAKKAQKDGKPSFIERAYMTPPTWNFTVDKPYTAVLPKADRSMGNYMSGAPMMPMMPMMQMPYDSAAFGMPPGGYIPAMGYPSGGYMPPPTPVYPPGARGFNAPMSPGYAPRPPYPNQFGSYPRSPQPNYSKFS